MPKSIVLFLNLLPYIGVIAAWIYVIVLTIRMRKPRLAYLLRVAFLILLVISICTTVIYGYRISQDNFINGPGCEGDSFFSCEAISDFFLGIWWGIISGALLLMNIILLLLTKRGNRGNTRE
jgi:hypothetical protein